MAMKSPLNRKTPGGVWALRGATIGIALLVLIVVGTIAYSAYEDYDAIRSELAGGSHPAVAHPVFQGGAETVTVDVTVANRGVYTLNVTMGCSYPTSNVVCQTGNLAVPPGQTGTLQFTIIVTNLSQYEASSSHAINGTVRVQMQPFVTLSIDTDFSGFVGSGGA